MTQLSFLCAQVGGIHVAVPLDRVIGVAECGGLTPLPFSPPSFEGLVLAMGQVVPQVGLGTMLGSPSIGGGVLIVISDAGGSVALRVDQVSAMVEVGAAEIEPSAPAEDPAAPLITAHFVVRGVRHGVLDLDGLVVGEALAPGEEPGAVMLAGVVPPSDAETGSAGNAAHLPFMLVEVAGEVYAFRTGDIVELTELSGLRAMPHAPDWVAGLVDLRGEPLMALSTAALLGLEARDSPAVGLVVRLTGATAAIPQNAGPESAGRVVLLAERALGIERFPPNLLRPMTQPMAGVESYLVDKPDSIIGVVVPDGLLAQIAEEVMRFIPQGGSASAAQVAEVGREVWQLLTMRVGTECCAIPLDRIERIQASVQLTPLPDDGRGFDALADVGDGVVPVIDLRRRSLSFPGDTGIGQTPCVLTRLEGAMAGILVDQVLRIEDVPYDRIEPLDGAHRLPISEIVQIQDVLVSVLKVDRLLPPL